MKWKFDNASTTYTSFTILIYLIAKMQTDLKQTSSLSLSVPFKPHKFVPLSRSETGVLSKKYICYNIFYLFI